MQRALRTLVVVFTLSRCGGGSSPPPSELAPDVASPDGASVDSGAPDAGSDTGADLCATVTCDAPTACSAPTCNPATGICEPKPANDGSACDDGDPCTGDGACSAGTCAPGKANDCDDQDPCTTDGCAAGACTHEKQTGTPTVSLGGVADGAFVKEDVTLVVTSAGGNLAVTLDGAPFDPKAPITAEGKHHVVATVTACSGASATSELSFTLDKTAPELTALVSPPPNAAGWSHQATTVTFVASDALSPLGAAPAQVVVDAETPAKIVSAEISDAAGNTATAKVTVKLDLTPPAVAITAPSATRVVQSGPEITLSGTVAADALSGLVSAELRNTQLQGGYPLAVGAFELPVPVDPGESTLLLTATDAAGNVGAAFRTVVVDTDKPHVAIQSPTDGQTVTSPTVTVTGLANDAVTGTITDQDVSVTVNGVVASVQNRLFAAQDVPLEPGVNVLTAVAVDPAGNTAEHAITLTWDDAPGPHLDLVSGAGQTAPVQTFVPEPVVVRLTGLDGAPVVGADVVFGVSDNDGTVQAEAPKLASPKDRSVVVTTDANGEAQAFWRLGTRSGAGVNRVRVLSAAAKAGLTVAATGTPLSPSNAFVHKGDKQTTGTGKAFGEPLEVLVTDALMNPVPGQSVTFTVERGDAQVSGATSATAVTDESGVARVIASAGNLTGNGALGVRADAAGLTGPTQTATGVHFILSAFDTLDLGATTVRGRIVDQDEAPIPGVPVWLEESAGDPVVTDASGTFELSNALVGRVHLEVGGDLVPDRRLPHLNFALDLQPGNTNVLDRPIYLVELRQGVPADGLTDQAIELPEVPGFRLTVPAGTKVTYPNGAKADEVSVSLVHFDQAPMTPVNGLSSRLLVTIQPSGARFDPPLPIQVPNVDGFEPGRKIELFSYDHDLETFVAIGTGTVSEDGTVVRSDPGVGVVKGGWHCGASPTGTGSSTSLTVSLSRKNKAGEPEGNGSLEGELFFKPGSLPIGLKGGFSTTVEEPVEPATDTELLARGSPGPNTHYEWCGTDGLTVSGPSCKDETQCEGKASFKLGEGAGSGARGIARVLHICDLTGECVQDDVMLTACKGGGKVTKALKMGADLSKVSEILPEGSGMGAIFGTFSEIKEGLEGVLGSLHEGKAPGSVVPGVDVDFGFEMSGQLEKAKTCCSGCPEKGLVQNDTLQVGVKIEAEVKFPIPGAYWGIPGIAEGGAMARIKGEIEGAFFQARDRCVPSDTMGGGINGKWEVGIGAMADVLKGALKVDGSLNTSIEVKGTLTKTGKQYKLAVKGTWNGGFLLLQYSSIFGVEGKYEWHPEILKADYDFIKQELTWGDESEGDGCVKAWLPEPPCFCTSSAPKTTSKDGCKTSADCPPVPAKTAACENGKCVYYGTTSKDCTSGADCPPKDGAVASCENGKCVYLQTQSKGDCTPPDCDDKNPCTTDTCDGGACKHTTAPAGSPCDDQVPCTVNDICDASGACHGTPKNDLCPAKDPCHAAECDAKYGCRYDTPKTGPCDDGVGCTTGDQCVAGVCKGAPQDALCKQAKPCHADVCDPKKDCQHPIQPGPCDDGDGCTVGDQCQAGACVAGPPKDCNDGKPCTKDSCTSPAGTCKNDPAPFENAQCLPPPNVCEELRCTLGDCKKKGPSVPGGPCDDGDACTGDDTCDAAGTCAGTEIDCDDDDPCTLDACDPTAGCLHLEAPSCTPVRVELTCTTGNLVSNAAVEVILNPGGSEIPLTGTTGPNGVFEAKLPVPLGASGIELDLLSIKLSGGASKAEVVGGTVQVGDPVLGVSPIGFLFQGPSLLAPGGGLIFRPNTALTGIYVNWTAKPAAGFRLNVHQAVSRPASAPDDASGDPASPAVLISGLAPVAGGPAVTEETTILLDSAGAPGEALIQKGFAFTFSGGPVAPGASVAIAVSGVGLGDTIAAIWLDASGTVLGQSATTGPLVARATNLYGTRPAGADGLHLELTGVVAGVLFDTDAAKAAISSGKIDLSQLPVGATRFTLDFADTVKEGQRAGTSWWTAGGQKVGDAITGGCL